MVSYRKGISQRNLVMKVLEPIPLQTAGFVQACQHLLDLFTCCSQMLSVQSPTEAVRCTFPKHSLSKPQGFIDRRQSLLNRRRAFTAEFQAVLKDERKSLVLRLVVRTLYFGAFVLIY